MSGKRNNAFITRGRPFEKGNPGRPKGSRNKTTIACENLMEGEAEGLTRKVIELAQSGNSVALRLCMERIYPIRKGRLINLDLPMLENATGIVVALGDILNAVSEGEITPDEGLIVSNLLEIQRRGIETAEIEKRVEVLERGETNNG